MKLFARLTFLAGCLFASSGNAAFFNGNEVHDYCQKKQTGFLVGYLSAFHDSLSMASTAVLLHDLDNGKLSGYQQVVVPYCLPKGVQLGQLIDILCQSLAAKPENRQLSAARLAFDTFKETYPCPKE